MVERLRDLFVFLLFVAVAVGTYTATQASAVDEPFPTLLPLLCIAAYVTYTVGSWLLDKSTLAPPRVDFSFPLYVLRDSAGLVLCTDEPDGGYLAVFTGPDSAARFREIRNIPNWSPYAMSQIELLDVLQFAKRSGRVQYVMINPLLNQYGFDPVFSLSHCLERLSE